MARQEEIKITILRKEAEDSLKSLQEKADALRNTLNNIPLGNASQAMNNQAAAARAAAQAQTAQANATAANLRVQREQAEVAAANLRTQREQVNLTNARQRSIRDLTAAQAEQVRLQQAQVDLDTAMIRQQNTIANGNRQYTTALRNLGNAIGQVNVNQAQNIRYMSDWIRNQQGMDNATVRASGNLRNAVGTFQTYTASVNAADGAVHRYRVSVNTATGEVYNLDRGVSTLSQTMGNAASSAVNMVKQLVGFTGVVQSLRMALNEMKSMSDEMVTYRKVTGASVQEMEQIRGAAYDIAKKYGQTPTDFLAAASNMARAGYGQNSIAMAELATQTQLVGDVTADAASQFLLAVDAGYRYKGSIEDLTHVLDAANEIDNNYATSIAKISEGMTLIASLGGQAGVPIEQLIAALGTMTAATQRSGAEMARGLRSIMLNVIGDTTTEIEDGVTVTVENIESMTDALKKYSPEIVKAAAETGKLINPMEAIGALAKAYKEGLFTEQDLFGISKDIAGQRYYNAFSALISNYDMYESMLQSISKSAGSAEKEWEAMMDAWSKKLKNLRTTWAELVNNNISEEFIKNLIDGGNAALEFAGNLQNLAMIAGGALVAVRALAAGFRDLRNPQVHNFGGVGGINAWAAGISAAVVALGLLNAAADQAFESATKGAQEAAQKAKEASQETQNLGNLVRQYNELAADGKIDATELETAKSLQSQIAAIIGEQADNYDLVNGKIQENIRLLSEAYRKQAEQSLATIRTQRANAGVNLLSVTDNLRDEITGAGLRFDRLNLSPRMGQDVYDYILNNFGDYVESNGVLQSLNLSMNSGMNVDQLTTFYQKAKDLQQVFASAYSTDELSRIGFYKDLKDGLARVAPAMEAYISLIQQEANAEAAVVLSKENFAEKTFDTQEALDSYLDSVAKSNNMNEEQRKALEDVAKAFSSVKKASDETTGGKTTTEKTKDEWDQVTESINAATEAKKKFDESMKTSKADAAKVYSDAFETLQKEIQAGRVNSDAYYAAARVLLGDEKFFSTDLSSQGVMAALKGNKGSGSALEAMGILGGDYKFYNGERVVEGKDAKGNAVYRTRSGKTIAEGQVDNIQTYGGYGVYELLTRTKNIEEILGGQKLKDENGNAYIPDLSYEQWTQVADQWGIAADSLIAYLDQADENDQKGKVTDETILADKAAYDKAKQEEQAEKDAEQKKATEDLTAAKQDEKEATEKTAEATEKAAESAEHLADAVEAAAEQQEEQNEINQKTDGQTEGSESGDTGSGLDFNQSQEKANQYLGTLEEIDKKIEDINGKTVTVKLEANTKPAEETINQYTKGKRPTVTANVDADTEQAAGKIEGFSKADRVTKPVEVPANTDKAEEEIKGVEEGDYSAKVDVDAKVASAQSKVNKLVDSIPEQRTIKIVTTTPSKGSNTVHGDNQDNSLIPNDTIKDQESDGKRLVRIIDDVILKYDELRHKATSNYIVGWMEDWQEYASEIKPVKLDITPSEATKKTIDFIESLAGQLADIKSFEESGNIDSDFAQEWSDSVTSAIQDALKSINNMDDLDAIQTTLEAEDLITPEIEKILNEKRDEITLTVGANTDKATSSIRKVENGKYKATLTVDADTTPALKKLDELIEAVSKFTKPALDDDGGEVTKAATGTRNHPGGLTLVNDGSGPELLVDNGNAFIAGDGKPTIVSLNKGAKVFTASETRKILSGGSVPAYAEGTRLSQVRAFAKADTGSGGSSKKDDSSGRGVTFNTKTDSDKKKKKDSNVRTVYAGYDQEPKYSSTSSDADTGSSGQSEPDNNDIYDQFKDMIQYIMDRLGIALEEQLDIIDKQINALKEERERIKQQDELEEKQKAVAEAQKDLAEAMGERTVRYLGEDGKWHWMADARKVQSAQENLDSAQNAYNEYVDNMMFNQQIKALEGQKTALQDEYNKLTKTWSDIQYGVATPTGTVGGMINQVLASGTALQRAGAVSVRDTLLGQLSKSIYGRNYDEAIDSIALATAGHPIMPGDSNTMLSSLIAMSGIENAGGNVSDALRGMYYPSPSGMMAGNYNYGGSSVSYNYFVDGMKIGSDQADMPLSSIMNQLTLHTNSSIS